MYSRDYGGKTLDFEASGGLTNASLVMQDKQTDTFWSLMKGKAVQGELDGEVLQTLSVGEKTTWQQWRQKYPKTKVLSVNSRQDGRNPYSKYFDDKNGFRGLLANDKRLETKATIFAFRHNGTPYAISYGEMATGRSFKLDDGKHVFLYRESTDEIFQSTSAFISGDGFSKQEDFWIENGTRSKFDKKSRNFPNGVQKLIGFDTFWYNWSLNNPESKILKSPTASAPKQ